MSEWINGSTLFELEQKRVDNVQKMKFLCSFLWIWSHLLKKSLMENFIYCGEPGLVFDNLLI